MPSCVQSNYGGLTAEDRANYLIQSKGIHVESLPFDFSLSTLRFHMKGISMSVNRDKPDQWKQDVAASVDLYNSWFLEFAPKTYRDERVKATRYVEDMLKRTNHLANLTPDELKAEPSILFALRMCTAPPIARDRLVGLTNVPKILVENMEKAGRLPPSLKEPELSEHLQKIVEMLTRLADEDIFTWLADQKKPTVKERHRAATIVADRLCGANANPIIRNAQEKRQLRRIKDWLEQRGYVDVSSQVSYAEIQPGTFAFRLIVRGLKDDGKPVNIPVDAVIAPKKLNQRRSPLLIEAKSAGDFTNTNKRRKEEATKVAQLRRQYGEDVRFALFLCGYFDTSYLGYEAAERIDWVWEHRIDDLLKFGL